MEAQRVIRFNDLSGWLKTAIIISWILGAVYGFLFVFGFAFGLFA